MGTKTNPGNYDCYAKADPNEPIFTLRGKDPIAPYLVEIWVATRRGEFGKARQLIQDAAFDAGVLERVSDDGYHKLDEALDCARSMRDWHSQRIHGDPKMQPATRRSLAELVDAVSTAHHSLFVICRLPLEDFPDSKPSYRTPEGGWTKSVNKAEQFITRGAAQSVLDEHSWGRDGHTIEEVTK